MPTAELMRKRIPGHLLTRHSNQASPSCADEVGAFNPPYGTLHVCRLNSILLFSGWRREQRFPESESVRPARRHCWKRAAIPETFQDQESPDTRDGEVPVCLCGALPFAHRPGVGDGAYPGGPRGRRGATPAEMQPLSRPAPLKASAASLPAQKCVSFLQHKHNQIYYIPVIVPKWGWRKRCFLGTKGLVHMCTCVPRGGGWGRQRPAPTPDFSPASARSQRPLEGCSSGSPQVRQETLVSQPDSWPLSPDTASRGPSKAVGGSSQGWTLAQTFSAVTTSPRRGEAAPAEGFLGNPERKRKRREGRDGGRAGANACPGHVPALIPAPQRPGGLAQAPEPC